MKHTHFIFIRTRCSYFFYLFSSSGLIIKHIFSKKNTVSIVHMCTLDNLLQIIKNSAKFIFDILAEWLRRWTRNPLESLLVGSNPADVAQISFSFSFYVQCVYMSRFESCRCRLNMFLFLFMFSVYMSRFESCRCRLNIFLFLFLLLCSVCICRVSNPADVV
jgi:hypothetical protein